MPMHASPAEALEVAVLWIVEHVSTLELPMALCEEPQPLPTIL